MPGRRREGGAAVQRAAASARFIAARALLGGAATVALLPDRVRVCGGDARTLLALAACFAAGAASVEIASARVGDRERSARRWLVVAAGLQAIASAMLACAGSIAAVAAGVAVAGVGAGVATGAEARTALAIGGDAVGVARVEGSVLFARAGVGLVIALAATATGIGARGAFVLASIGALLGAVLASTLRVADGDAHACDGRRVWVRPFPSASLPRRNARSLGVITLMIGVAALTLAARGTDPIDAFAVSARGGTVMVCVMPMMAKGVVARVLAPALVRAGAWGAASAAALAGAALLLVAHVTILPSALVVAMAVIACSSEAATSSGARGLLSARLGAAHAGVGAAIESTARRLLLGGFALSLAWTGGGIGRAPYALAGAAGLVGALAVITPMLARSARRTLAQARSLPTGG